jgi:DNA polymerase-3 subunit epsilon
MLDRIGHLIKRPGLPDPSYRFLLEAERADEAVSLDCETTGFDPRVDEVVSIAAIRIAGRRILASSAFRALVRPEGAMRPDSIKVHRLRQQDVAQAQPMSEVLLLYFIGSRPLVGYWIQFDVRMLDKYLLAMIDMRLPSREIDVSRLLRSQIREHAARHARRFALCRHSADLKLPTRAQHDAFEDALGAAEMYLVLEDMRERSVRLPRQRSDLPGAFSIA